MVVGRETGGGYDQALKSVGLYVIVKLQTSADYCRNNAVSTRIDPAYQCATARPASSGIKVLRAICTKIVEEDDEYGNDLADT